MQPIDIEEVKRVSAKLGWRDPTQVPLTSPVLTKSQGDIEELLRSQFAKSGFPVDKLSELRAAVQEEQRKLFEARLAETAKNLAADETALRQQLENLGQAQRLLTDPFQSHLVILEEPFLIWQYPHPQLDIFIESGRAPNNSFIRVKVNVHSRKIDNDTHFVFHFLWRNPNKFTAVVKANTSLIFNGSCMAEADLGSFPSVAEVTLILGASHRMWRWIGWGNDAVTGDQTLIWDFFVHHLADLVVRGGWWPFPKTVALETAEFVFQRFSLNADPIIVPPFATIMYEVAVNLSYTIKRIYGIGGPGEFDIASFDFANGGPLPGDFGHRIICPGAVLEVLTPLPSKSGRAKRMR